MNYARALALLLAVFAGCSRREASAPSSDGYWYPEQILTDTERRDESAGKIARLTEWLRARGHEGVLLSTPENFAWVTAGGNNRVEGFPCGEFARLLFAPDGRRVLIAPAGDTLRIAREELAGIDYELQEVSPCGSGNAERAAERFAPGKALVRDEQDGPHARELAALRVPLGASEIRKYRWLGKRCGEVVDRVCRGIQPGMTERGIEAMLSSGLVRHAITPVRIVVTADARAAKYGPVPASEKTKVEQTVIVGVSAARWGLLVGLVRQVNFGSVSEDTRKAAEAVAAMVAGFWARTLPGTPAGSIFSAALQDCERLGFPIAAASMHGGAVSYGRDWFACTNSEDVVRSGQTFAWSAFASPVAVEDTILVTGDQLEVLTEIRGWPVEEFKTLGRVYRTPAILVR